MMMQSPPPPQTQMMDMSGVSNNGHNLENTYLSGTEEAGQNTFSTPQKYGGMQMMSKTNGFHNNY